MRLLQGLVLSLALTRQFLRFLFFLNAIIGIVFQPLGRLVSCANSF